MTPPAEAQPVAPFAGAEFEARRASIRKELAGHGLDALLVVSPENIYYLLGLNYQGYFAFTLLVLPVDGAPRLLTRAVEGPTVAAQVSGIEHVMFSDDEDLVTTAVNTIRAATGDAHSIGVERSTMFFPLAMWEGIRDTLTDRRWADGSGVIERVRAVKSEAELALIRRAARVSDKAIRAGIDAAGSDVSEREVAAHVYHKMIASGSEDPGFAPLIRSGDALDQEHVTWRDRRLAAGESLFLELSSSVHRYHAPLSRIVHVGLPPGVRYSAEVANDGLSSVLAALRPGTTAGSVYAAWQAVVDAALGHSRFRRHHCGYLVGIGFPPSWVGGSTVVGLRSGSELLIRAGMVFHVLSWLWDQPDFGPDYLVSDTVLVTETGSELLTRTPREPTDVS